MLYEVITEPFFIDTAVERDLLQEAYERSKKEVRISYMSFDVNSDDTIIAFNKAMTAYNRVMSGEDFTKVALELSESKYVSLDKGDGWYNKVFILPYKLENYAFTVITSYSIHYTKLYEERIFFWNSTISSSSTPKLSNSSNVTEGNPDFVDIILTI